MPSSPAATGHPRPIIGLTSYRKKIGGKSPLEMIGVSVAYAEAVIAAGGIPIMIPQDLDEPAMQRLLDQIDGLLLPGGGDVHPVHYDEAQRHPTLRGLDKRRDALELFMARGAVSQYKPLLAICRGHQLLNVALGGTLWLDLRSQVPEAIGHDCYRDFPRHHTPHTVDVRSGSRLADCLGEGPIPVNSLHHQGIRELAPQLEAVARASDGLVEGVEIVDHPFAIGVQWHPENLIHHDPAMLSLFRKFVEAAAG